MSVSWRRSGLSESGCKYAPGFGCLTVYLATFITWPFAPTQYTAVASVMMSLGLVAGERTFGVPVQPFKGQNLMEAPPGAFDIQYTPLASATGAPPPSFGAKSAGVAVPAPLGSDTLRRSTLLAVVLSPK